MLRDLGVEAPGPISGPNLELLEGYDWPGNVRELRNVLQRAVACMGSHPVRFSELGLRVGGRPRAAARVAAIDLDQPFLEAKDALVSGFDALL